jgi:hypothetical protein
LIFRVLFAMTFDCQNHSTRIRRSSAHGAVAPISRIATSHAVQMENVWKLTREVEAP